MEWKKIRRDTARKMFENGETIYLIPNKTRMDNQWLNPVGIDWDNELSFDGAVSAYEYYNCNKELGTKVAFYVPVPNTEFEETKNA